MFSINYLEKRYATKKFDTTKTLSGEQLSTLLETIRLAPTSYGMQAFKLLVIENKATRLKLQEVSRNQPQVADASHLFLFCRRIESIPNLVEQHIQNIAKVRNVDVQTLADYQKIMTATLSAMSEEQVSHWMDKQCYLALGMVLDVAAQMGIDSCPLEGFVKSSYDEILNLKDLQLGSVVALAVGFRSSEDKYQHVTKVRKCNEELILTIK